MDRAGFVEGVILSGEQVRAVRELFTAVQISQGKWCGASGLTDGHGKRLRVEEILLMQISHPVCGLHLIQRDSCA